MQFIFCLASFLYFISHTIACTIYGPEIDGQPCEDSTMPLLDVLIIGGGPGGLAVATGLARQLYTAAVFDSGIYRNARSKHAHNILTWDHSDPADYRAKARSDLSARYNTIQIVETEIESVRRNENGRFEARDSAGNVWTGKKLALASGVKDIYPGIPGYDDVWGRGV